MLNLMNLLPNLAGSVNPLATLPPKAFTEVIERLDEIKRLNITLDIDKAIDIHDKQINILLSKERKKHEEKSILMAALMAMGTNNRFI